MRVLPQILFFAAAASAAVPYQQYILAPPSRTLRPIAVRLENGTLSTGAALLDNQTSPGQNLTLPTFNSTVTYDFGKNIAGWVNFNTTSSDGAIGFTFTESSLWISSEACDASGGSELDAPLVFNITSAGHYAAPTEKERGAFRYLTVVNLGSDQLSIDDLWVHFTAMPHWEDDALGNYTGWFHSNDEKLNRVWYAGAYTDQLVTIDPTRGNAVIYPASTSSGSSADGFNWYLNTTITNGTSTVTDGAKRDRLVWSGDMSIAVPGIAVTTFDLISVQNALDSLYSLQNPDGMLPYAGIPFNDAGTVSFTYHLYALIGVGNFFHYGGDRSYLDGKWAQWKAGMEWAAAQIDGTGLANVTSSADWLRFGMGGHNIEANSILFYTLNLGVALAQNQNDSATADRWAQLAAGIQAAAIPLLWQPDVGLFRDNETTTLAPQDGNSWAVKSGLVTNASQVVQISNALQGRWGQYGAPAPEAADAVSPFISGFELETHFAANRTTAALTLIRNMWADFMLDDVRMTNSTFIEGYSTSGELHYAPYGDEDARISLAHGWGTGPTSSLTTYVGGIQLVGAAGATWAIVPQVGDLTHVDAGFSTTLGRFSSKWFTDGSVFRLEISTPKGTTGTVGIPFPGNRTTATLICADRPGVRVTADDLGKYWITDLAGGDHQFVVVGW
ncbi:Six-hairpin glycosidase [Dichomitus squalens]|uniref:Six-hairpin glycosidase n=1 Tax=Dichomitus squalens TaxID=114155 RepID=A0A4Q9PZ17_9APHY|nr:Six-hairpin glycosidase [Dichomitus squalens]